jgi:nucleoside-diphosphate-sugar epimerase
VNKTVFITGASGFVGCNIMSRLTEFNYRQFNRNEKVIINEEVVLHLAGKAHDLKRTSNTNEYYKVNTELTKKVFDAFLNSNAKVFITISSVKAVADKLDSELTEEYIPNPITHYGKSKLLAEEYILSNLIPNGKRVFILRPCMIHGPGNKGNLNLLFKIVSKGIPWPLGAFKNKRSFCSIDNLCFIIDELIKNEQIPSGIYNVADDEPLSTNEVITLIYKHYDKQPNILNVSKYLITTVSKLGDLLKFPLNTERLNKLTESYIVSNKKIKDTINKPLPISSINGLLKTFRSFDH